MEIARESYSWKKDKLFDIEIYNRQTNLKHIENELRIIDILF